MHEAGPDGAEEAGRGRKDILIQASLNNKALMAYFRGVAHPHVIRVRESVSENVLQPGCVK